MLPPLRSFKAKVVKSRIIVRLRTSKPDGGSVRGARQPIKGQPRRDRIEMKVLGREIGGGAC